MNVKKLVCYMRAIPLFLRCGYFCPHLYVEKEVYKADVFVDKRNFEKFRVANTMQHGQHEQFIKNAVLIGCECKRCGHKMMEVQRTENLPIIK